MNPPFLKRWMAYINISHFFTERWDKNNYGKVLEYTFWITILFIFSFIGGAKPPKHTLPKPDIFICSCVFVNMIACLCDCTFCYTPKPPKCIIARFFMNYEILIFFFGASVKGKPHSPLNLKYSPLRLCLFVCMFVSMGNVWASAVIPPWYDSWNPGNHRSWPRSPPPPPSPHSSGEIYALCLIFPEHYWIRKRKRKKEEKKQGSICESLVTHS